MEAASRSRRLLRPLLIAAQLAVGELRALLLLAYVSLSTIKAVTEPTYLSRIFSLWASVYASADPAATCNDVQACVVDGNFWCMFRPGGAAQSTYCDSLGLTWTCAESAGAMAYICIVVEVAAAACLLQGIFGALCMGVNTGTGSGRYIASTVAASQSAMFVVLQVFMVLTVVIGAVYAVTIPNGAQSREAAASHSVAVLYAVSSLSAPHIAYDLSDERFAQVEFRRGAYYALAPNGAFAVAICTAIAKAHNGYKSELHSLLERPFLDESILLQIGASPPRYTAAVQTMQRWCGIPRRPSVLASVQSVNPIASASLSATS